MNDKALFIFRRDLRLHDNIGLNTAISKSKKLVLCFIFDPEQTDAERNSFFGENSFGFLIEALNQLREDLKSQGQILHFFEGKPEQVVEKLINQEKISALYFNDDYTPFSRRRDQKIKQAASRAGVSVTTFDDTLLNPMGSIRNKQGGIYSVFSYFFKEALQLSVAHPEPLRETRTETLKDSGVELLQKYLRGRQRKMWSSPRQIIESLERFHEYKNQRDYLEYRTTGLSPHLKFGTLSIREVYHAIKNKLGKDHELIRQLYWREFFYYIAYYNPHVFEGAFHRKFNKLDWHTDKKLFSRWCEGKTGFPVVDAGMRELASTGNMPNRARLICASFLVKDLHQNWQAGERYFASKLLDYDPCINNGNWQWVASTGCDAQPFFRIFNPWRQQLKFDPRCSYIKTWIPELKQVKEADIHKWYKKHSNYQVDYPAPVIDHDIEKSVAEEMYAEL